MSIKRAGGSRTTGPARLINDALLPAYVLSQLTDSPALCWPMQESSGVVVTDVSGNGRNGTYTGSPGLAAGAVANLNTSVSFPNDVNKYAQIAHAAWMEGNAGLTWEGLIYLTAKTNYPTMCGDDSGGAPRAGFFRVDDGGTTATFYIVPSSGSAVSCTANYSFSTTTSYHFAATWNGTGNVAKVYVNGVEKGSTSAGGNYTTGTSANPFIVGRSYYSGFPWQGRPAGFAYYQTCLSAARILAHAQAAGLT